MEQVESIIRQEIISSGSISFARFMELALYCPKIGYYERDFAPIGRTGDFYTSVSTGPLFGELLALQFAEWLSKSGPGELTVIEAGASDGQLTADLLGSIKKCRPRLSLKFAIVEPSERRRAVQQAKLAVFAGQVTWFASLDALPPVTGIMFSNELLDAMPVHVLQWQGGKWVELRVALGSDSFAWQPVELTSDIGQPTVAPELAAVLPDGFQIEVSPAGRRWWRAAAAKLARGKLVTIDYGFESDEAFMPQRAAGTLRACYRHHLSLDVLARPGEQDITSHINFSEIKVAGESCGLRTDVLVTQAQFLTGMAAKISDWNSERVRQFQTLTHPEHLGRSFKVLVQSR
jgi:SAM-dependent MidA family methyltransferase